MYLVSVNKIQPPYYKKKKSLPGYMQKIHFEKVAIKKSLPCVDSECSQELTNWHYYALI
jgi:hypothetical protein